MPSTTRTTVAAGLAVAGLAVATATAPAAGRWRPYRAEDFVAPAGERCPFELSGTVVRDKERIRTLARFPNGDPRREEVRGPLVVRYANRDTGKTVRRDLTGHATVTHFRDGGTLLRLVRGRFAAGLAATDPGGPAFLVFRGRGHAVRVRADGSRVVHRGHGRVEDLCTTLSPSAGR